MSWDATATIALLVFVVGGVQTALLIVILRSVDSIAKEFDDAYCRTLEREIEVLERKSR